MSRKLAVILSILIFLIIVKFIYSYFSTYEYSFQARADLAAEKKQDIHVAVVWDKYETSFMQGVMMAVAEINQQGVALKSNNEIIKARLVLHQFDDSTETSAQKTRLSIASDHRIVAVLGHSTSASAIPASITYEYNGILFISAVATMPTLTNHNFKYTFSIIPSEFFFANRLVQFVKKKGWNNLLILHARNPYGLSFYEAFAAQVEPPLHIISVKSFFTGEKDYKELIYTVMMNDFDAVILADAEQNAAEMIKQLRNMGMNKPILGGDGLDNLKIWAWSGQTSNQLYVASVLSGYGGSDNKDDQVFSSNYVIYQGYESAHILADAIEKTGSSEPILVASTLKYNYKNGYAGYIFDVNGLVTNKNIYIKEFKNGKFLSVDDE